MYFMSYGNNLGHGHLFAIFWAMGKLFGPWDFFLWAMARKVAMGEKNVAHGKNGKMLISVYF